MSIIVDESAVKRINELRSQRGEEALMLRVRVEGGGCAGFSYKMDLTDEVGVQDQSFADSVVTDDISLTFLDGSTILFEDKLIGAEFVINNPNAASGCGCGTSFSLKD